MVLLFARSGLYRDRAQRPGFAKVIASLVQVVLVVLIYAEIEGHEFTSYYIFYGTLFFALVYVSVPAGCSSASAASCCARPATAAARCSSGSGPNIEAVAHALRDSKMIEPYGFVSRTPAPRPTACATSARSSSSSATSTPSTRC